MEGRVRGTGGDGVTDLATRPGVDGDTIGEAGASDIVTAADGTDAPPPSYEWAPAEPAPRKRRLWLWIGIPVALLGVAAAASSLALIAPGTAIAGVPVGGMTPGAAAEAVQQRLATTTVVLTGDGGGAVVTAAELGASVDARGLADDAFASHPAWNLGSWFASPSDAHVVLDTAVATAALRAAAPQLYSDPVDATLAFDPASASYVTTPAVDGQGVDETAVRAALQQALDAGAATVELDATRAPVDPGTPTYVATAAASTLNRMLSTAGFYVGGERTVPVQAATIASWITIEPGERGTFDISVTAADIEPLIEGLPAAVERAVVNATVITNAGGEVLSTPTAGVTGRTLESTAGIAKAYAAQLRTGNAVYELPVTETAFTTTSLARLLEVDLSEQRLYLKENGAVVDSWAVSSGKGITPTFTGHYSIYSKATVQTMRGYDRDAQGNIIGEYTTPNVKWPMYFNGGQAFHGVYWHNNYGYPMSHGCVGMPEWRAQQVYHWAPYGTDVWIHS